MSPFNQQRILVSGFKEKPEALAVHGDRLYVGTATGNLHVYAVDDSPERTEPLELVEVKKNLTKRSIDQLAVIKDLNSLVSLSESLVTLHALPQLISPTPLTQAKDAFCFQLHSSVQHLPPDDPKTIPTLVTHLIVGCRRRVVLYTWKDGEAQDVKETPLPHSARRIIFVDPHTVCFAYSSTEHALFSLTTMTATDLSTPVPNTASAMAFSKYTGYMTLGLGGKQALKPAVCKIGEGEVLVVKENEGYPLNTEGKSSRAYITWTAPPEDVVYIKPYIISSLPPGATSPTSPTPTTTPSLQIRSSIAKLPFQTLVYPFAPTPQPTSPTSSPPSTSLPSQTTTTAAATTTTTVQSTAPVAAATLRLLTPSSSSKTPCLLAVSTPTDRTIAASEGSTVWKFPLLPWVEQVERLTDEGEYGDALTLLESLDEGVVSDKTTKLTLIRALHASSLFRTAQFEKAIKIFNELDVNPAKVVALYPESISGRLAVGEEEWTVLFGGRKVVSPSGGKDIPPLGKKDSEGETTDAPDALPSPPFESRPTSPPFDASEKDTSSVTSGEQATTALENVLGGLESALPVAGSIRGRLKHLGGFIGGGVGVGGIGAGGGGAKADDDTASIRSTHSTSNSATRKKGSLPPVSNDLTRSLEALLLFLPSRRSVLDALLSSLHITPEESHKFPPLSETSVQELFALPPLPNSPSTTNFTSLTPEQLLRCAQVVDTALFKAYLVVRPGMVGALCRRYNWCEVGEVEEELRAREKYLELIDLYHGKRMHSKALALLRELSEKESNPQDKVEPSIRYLQKLGPEHLDHIFETSRWVFAEDEDMGLEIYTSEELELPRDAVIDFLERMSKPICVRYIEFLIEECGEQTSAVHDRLASLYLSIVLDAQKQKNSDVESRFYEKLLGFINGSERLSVDRLYGQISSYDLFEARALLLGRLERHDQALELYVYRLQDYTKAEEYCKRVYLPTGPTSQVYLILLRTYLRPTIKRPPPDLLKPAMDLMCRHSPRLDSAEALDLIPPLVTVQEVQTFLKDALHAPVFDSRVITEISRARDEQVSRRLMILQSKRVKVVDSRICPNCHKRIGNNSVIAVHSPRGEVTHYQCREDFSKKVNARK
ncbi:hypothetical protein BDV98DRAFT_591033 [Pterulicium gracile]|uniref:CNH domain-containing protein n=1 Tax=Pterulicium gracile TaxID=1884261 RepID=A0A5C3R0H1_9AGAR|nr:hypothetical protein BDV98DRAFT_591033 [Pterula gracilis]